MARLKEAAELRGNRMNRSSHLAAAADRAAVEPFTGLPQVRSMDTGTDQKETSLSSERTVTVEIEKSPSELHRAHRALAHIRLQHDRGGLTSGYPADIQVCASPHV